MSDGVRATAPKRVVRAPADKSCSCVGRGPGECNCPENGQSLQRAANGGPGPASVPASVARTVASPGQPLDAGARATMESRFGRDFGGVRVHTDHQAAESARAVNARAYTVGQHITFDRGQYQPHTPAGQHLLAHELAHTMQQRGLQRKPSESAILDPGLESRFEREADTAAASLAGNGPSSISPGAPGGLIQRAPWGVCPPSPPAVQLDARDELINQSAEKRILEYYKQGRNPEAIISNQNKLDEATPQNRELRRLIELLKGEFFTRYEPARFRRRELTGEPDVVAAEPEAGDPESDVALGRPTYGRVEGQQGQQAARAEQEPALKRPDILDLESGEVYDVTTVGMAGGKVEKINISYIELLNDIVAEAGIVGPRFRPGMTLAAPPPQLLVYEFAPGRVICYGETDFETNAGVIAYRALEVAGTAPAAGGVAGEPYLVSLLGQQVSLVAGGVGSVTDLRNSGPENLSASQAFKGLILLQLRRGKTKSATDRIDATVATDVGATPLPITFEGEKRPIVFTVDQATRALKLRSSKVNLPFAYQYLSKGAITDLVIGEGEGVSGTGWLTPSLPLLRRMRLKVEFGPDRFEVVAGLDPKKIRMPFGARVTKAELGLLLHPEFKPTGEVEFEVGRGRRKVLDGRMAFEADAGGLVAVGAVRAYLPGVDAAEGTIEYRAGQWTGQVTIAASQIGIPALKDASVTVVVAGGADGPTLTASGFVLLGLPGDNEVRLEVIRREGGWAYRGKGRLVVPGVKPVDFAFYYVGDKLRGTASTEVEVKDFKGKLTLEYDDGRLSGEGTISGRKGRANLEQARVRYNGRTGKFSGEGTLSYQVGENLIATAGVEIPEKGPVKLKGLLTFPKPIPLFKRFGDDFTIFRLPDIDIPIPGASIGPVGLEVHIRGRLDADYSIGPGELQNTRIGADFQPFEENKDLKVDLVSLLVIPASATLTADFSAGVAIDVFVAEVEGSIGVKGSATLAGGLSAAFTAHYEKDRFTAEVTPQIDAALILTLRLYAKLRAEAGVGPFSVSTTKTWEIDKFTYVPGIKVGMKAPIRYDSAASPSFRPPSLDEIQWVRPTIEPRDLLSKGMAGKGNEVED